MSISNHAEDQLLDAVFNADTTGLPAGDLYLQLHNGDPGEAGTTNVVDVARVQVAMGSASGGTLSNSGNVDFTSMPADTVVAWSFHDAAGSGNPPSGGDCWWTGWFSVLSGLAVVNDTDAGNNDIQSPEHGLTTNDRVVFEAIEGLTSPAGLTMGSLYHVIATGLTTDAFRVSTSQGGSAQDITDDGQCIWRKVTPKTTNSGDTFRIATGDMDIYLD